ncbi:hypothetical protein GCM10012275_20600 [Longimycelium tulufanense]|uniref:DUF397 domain-containing protein n=1 Tax=Longimycelium tulufanense TaxID=907463 RepID=A0A8J3C7J6_9PSEU|nr:DUF397 domain-containing protein [Longimycelium tulufanense]GGM49569.1 hypothetical protein GCM10012275_20600 [Longimycelium tulufanense]
MAKHRLGSWRTSSRTCGAGGAGGGKCVEVGSAFPIIGVRDSKNPEGAILTFSPREWSAFLARLRSGVLDLQPAPHQAR